MKFYVRKGVQDRLQAVVNKYGHLMDKPPGTVKSNEQAAIIILLHVIKEMDKSVTRMIRLADLAIKDSAQVEELLMSTNEGKDLMEHLERTRPEIFEGLSNARYFWDA